jgi:small subunit ribosomal protein S20
MQQAATREGCNTTASPQRERSPNAVRTQSERRENTVANHPSADKRNRQNIKRRERNTHVRSSVRTFVKRVRAAVEAGNVAEAKTALIEAIQHIDQAVTKGVYHQSTGSRYVSRLSAQVAALSAS